MPDAATWGAIIMTLLIGLFLLLVLSDLDEHHDKSPRTRNSPNPRKVRKAKRGVNGLKKAKHKRHEPVRGSTEKAKEDKKEEPVMKAERENSTGNNGDEGNCCRELLPPTSAEMIREVLPGQAEPATKWEAEKKEINSKLDLVISILEHFQWILQIHEEDVKKVNDAMSGKLDEFHGFLGEILGTNNQILHHHLQPNEEKVIDMSMKLSEANSWGEYYFQASHSFADDCQRLAEEKRVISGKLDAATSLSEKYKAYHSESEERCWKLEEDNSDLAAKLFTETLSCERLHKIVAEGEEKCKRLEDEKADLTAELSALKTSCELYKSYIKDMAA